MGGIWGTGELLSREIWSASGGSRARILATRPVVQRWFLDLCKSTGVVRFRISLRVTGVVKEPPPSEWSTSDLPTDIISVFSLALWTKPVRKQR